MFLLSSGCHASSSTCPASGPHSVDSFLNTATTLHTFTHYSFKCFVGGARYVPRDATHYWHSVALVSLPLPQQQPKNRSNQPLTTTRTATQHHQQQQQQSTLAWFVGTQVIRRTGASSTSIYAPHLLHHQSSTRKKIH